MSTLYQAVISAIGPVPTGAEPIVYIFCLVLLMFLLNGCLSIVNSAFGRQGRR